MSPVRGRSAAVKGAYVAALVLFFPWSLLLYVLLRDRSAPEHPLYGAYRNPWPVQDTAHGGFEDVVGPGPGPLGSPQPGEVWWALVPYAESDGAKDRPCVVLEVNGGLATVAKITSKDQTGRPGALLLPPGTVGGRADGRQSWLQVYEVRQVPLYHFRRPGGRLDAGSWAALCSAHRGGWGRQGAYGSWTGMQRPGDFFRGLFG
jgi:mRNA-degrading endonuclease toxin of MazEF toxin-antitoxin module